MRDKIEKNETFLKNLTEEQLAMVGQQLLLDNYPMALISPELTVLHQNQASERVLDENIFYSLESYLPQEICEGLQTCMEERRPIQMTLELVGLRWALCANPTQEGALLVFQPVRERQIGLTSSASVLYNIGSNLLYGARNLEEEDPGTASKMRYEAMRALRQANRLEILWGALPAMNCRRLAMGAIVRKAAQHLAELNVGIWTRLERGCAGETIIVDERMLLGALGALICNSLKYGGKDVHIALHASWSKRGALFTVDDDGPGLSPEARLRMDNTWRKKSAFSGSWGLGVPYAREIAAMHGGSLLFTNAAKNTGCSARLFIPNHAFESELAESSFGLRIIDSPVSPIDIEMSGVLEASAYFKHNSIKHEPIGPF